MVNGLGMEEEKREMMCICVSATMTGRIVSSFLKAKKAAIWKGVKLRLFFCAAVVLMHSCLLNVEMFLHFEKSLTSLNVLALSRHVGVQDESARLHAGSPV